MEERETLYAKWLSGNVSDKELLAQEGADALEQLQKVVDTVDNWSMPSYDVKSGFEKMKIKHLSPTTKVKRLPWRTLSGIAAGFAVLIACWLILGKNKSEVLKAEYGQNYNFTFSDESQIWLNDGSTLEHFPKDWASERTVKLKGEALFEVEKGSPFKVNTELGSITVLGTKFNVRAWGENLYVECYEGKVEVISNKQSSILTAGESVNVIQNVMKGKQVITNVTPTWQNGSSRFYEEQLKIVCSELERQYNIEVNLLATDRLFSGNFRHDNLESALTSVCKPLGLKYKISPDSKSVVIE